MSTLHVQQTCGVAMAAMFSSSHHPMMDNVMTLDLSSLWSINQILLDDIAKVSTVGNTGYWRTSGFDFGPPSACGMIYPYFLLSVFFWY